MKKSTIGMLHTGQYFILDGIKYRVGKLVKNTNGYVSCTDISSGKRISKRMYIDTSVYVEEEADYQKSGRFLERK